MEYATLLYITSTARFQELQTTLDGKSEIGAVLLREKHYEKTIYELNKIKLENYPGLFTSIDQVVAKWAEFYVEMPLDVFFLPSPGYPDSEIVNLERSLGFQLPVSMIEVLRQVNLDTADFRNVTFGGGQGFIAYLRKWNDGTHDHNALTHGMLDIGSAGLYVFLMDINNGRVYAYNTDIEDGELVADSLEQFILRAASIDAIEWPDWKNKTEAIEDANRFLDENGILEGRRFWVHFVRNAL